MTYTVEAEQVNPAPIRKAIVLAAGRGKRMRPLTDTTAKPLLEVAGRSLIDYHLKKLASAGITHLVINISWQAEKIKSTVGDGSKYGLHIDYSHEPTALETAGGIRKALHLLGDSPFLVVSADVWCDVEYGDFISKSPSACAHLLMVDNPEHHPTGDFTIDSTDRLGLKSNGSSIFPAPNTYTYSGIGLYHPCLFKNLPLAPAPLRDVLIPATESQQITASVYDGLWFDVGTVERLQSLDDYLRHV